jgi:pimeloyl-ACP methyl ester carboxylesterase
MDSVRIERAALVGASFGGQIALEVAVARPDRVSALVLVCSGLPDHEWSDVVEAYSAEEDAAFEGGDIDTAVEANLRMWVDGPHRAPDAVDPSVRAAVGEMQRRAFEHWLALPEDAREAVDEEALVPDLGARLGEVAVPTLIVLGELDVDDMHAIAERLSREIPGARFRSVAGTAHLPSLERPDEVNEVLLGFLGGASGAS